MRMHTSTNIIIAFRNQVSIEFALQHWTLHLLLVCPDGTVLCLQLLSIPLLRSYARVAFDSAACTQHKLLAWYIELT